MEKIRSRSQTMCYHSLISSFFSFVPAFLFIYVNPQMFCFQISLDVHTEFPFLKSMYI